MTDKARELKQELERIFAVATAASDRRACPAGGDVPMDDETRTAFDSGVVDKSKSGSGKSGASDHEKVSVVDEAMRVCKVNDVVNKRTFTSVMLTKSPADCLEEIMAFESEICQGEHAKAKNLPAILTARLKALRSQG